MESYYFEGDASSVRRLFLGALMYSHPISDNLPTKHPFPPPLAELPLSLKHRAKLNLYEVYSIYRTNYTKLYKLYERLMGPKWKNDECVCASPNTETVNFASSNVSQAAVTSISCNHLFVDFLF